MWTDVNAGAARRGDEVPDYPIRIVFKKRKGPMGDAGIEFDTIRELTAEEARSSKALGRGDQEKLAQDQIKLSQNAERAWVMTELVWPQGELKVVFGASRQGDQPQLETTT